MPTYYLRMEGVNLSSVFDDTNQISVIRGASLLLRESTKIIKKRFPQLNEISIGASIGLFEFETQESGESIRQQVADYLSKHFKLKYFTFIVDIQEKTDSFIKDKEALIARNRFRQMQQLSFAIPKQKGKMVCELTNLLPVTDQKKVTVGEDDLLLSDSIRVRLRYGRQRRKFYRQEIQLNITPVKNLHELTEYSDAPINLNYKMAVLYLDGNGFSKIQQEHCKQATDARKFDQELQAKRQKFLKDFLPAFLNYDRLRLEVLLWGGDEMLLIVPAWKGLELLHRFYEASHDWKFKEKELTHSGGLVFCRAKTPIRRIRYFAQELADSVKNSKKIEGRKNNFFDYMVLESIDYPSESLDKLREKIFPKTLVDTYLPLYPFTTEMLHALQYLKANVPKSQAYGLVRAITQSQAAYEEKRKRLTQVINNSEYESEINKNLAIAFPDQEVCWQWIHLVELWDYIPKEQENATVLI